MTMSDVVWYFAEQPATPLVSVLRVPPEERWATATPEQIREDLAAMVAQARADFERCGWVL